MSEVIVDVAGNGVNVGWGVLVGNAVWVEDAGGVALRNGDGEVIATMGVIFDTCGVKD